MRTALSCWNFFSSRGCGRRLHPREGRQRHEFVVGPRDVHAAELVGRQPLGALHLGNDFVAASLDAEPVHVVAAEKGREIPPGLPEVDTLRPQLVAVEDHLRLRLVELQVGVGEHEHPAGKRLLHQLLGELAQPLGLGR
jgi:hypothetical protein